MTTTTYDVIGMTCQHCVHAVTKEVGSLAGVGAVVVDVSAGTVRVTSTEPLVLDVVGAAIDEAGYELTGVHA
ncbi:MAG: heavy-metal-associated domain-containing protein [Cellulomonas sp.]